MNDFSRFLSICKIDDDQRMVWGYATTPALDIDGEMITLAAVKNALPDYMAWGNIREMHQPSAVGIAKEATMDDKGLWLGAHVVDDDAWAKVKAKVYKGFSIGGNATKRTGNIIEEMNLIEISLVDRPANPECRIEIVKGASVSEDGPVRLVKNAATSEPEQITATELGIFGRVAKAMGLSLGLAKTTLPVRTEPTLPVHTESAAPSLPVPDPQWDPIVKNMMDVAELSGAFLTTSRVGGWLRHEAQREGGDKVDLTMADKSLEIARQIGELIIDVTTHEMNELSTHDNEMLALAAGTTAPGGTMSITKRRSAKDSFGKAVESINKAADGYNDTLSAVQALAAMFGSYAKAAKDKKDKKEMPDDFDMAGAASCMKKAADSLVKVGEGIDMTEFHIKKMGEALGPGDSGSGWEAPPGIKDLSQASMTEGSVPDYPADQPYSGKGAFSQAQVDALVKSAGEAAYWKGKAEALEKMPAGVGGRATAFDLRKAATGLGGNQPENETDLLLKGVDVRADDPDSVSRAAGKMIGNMLANPGVFGRNPITDPNFRGGAGL